MVNLKCFACTYMYVCQLWNLLHSWPSLAGGIPHSSFLLKISSLLIKGVSCPCGGLGQEYVINSWPVKPFETLKVIKGLYKYKWIKWIHLITVQALVTWRSVCCFGQWGREACVSFVSVQCFHPDAGRPLQPFTTKTLIGVGPDDIPVIGVAHVPVQFNIRQLSMHFLVADIAGEQKLQVCHSWLKAKHALTLETTALCCSRECVPSFLTANPARVSVPVPPVPTECGCIHQDMVDSYKVIALLIFNKCSVNYSFNIMYS